MTKQQLEQMKEEAHLQECRVLIQQNISMYKQQVEARHQEA